MILAAETSSGDFTDPAVWVNLGVAGVFLFAFFSGRLHSAKEMTTFEKLYNTQLDNQKLQYDAAIVRMDKQIDDLTNERNRAYEQRDEMVEVIQDFTATASTILPMLRETRSEWRSTGSKPPAKRRSPGGEGQ